MSKTDIRRELVAAIKTELDHGVIPIQEGWLRNQPYNPKTGTKYAGVNRLWLSYISRKKGWVDNRFLTFKNASDMHAKVKKGEDATKIEFFRFYDKRKPKRKLTSFEWESLDPDDRGVARNHFNVFNGEQVEGLGDAATGGADMDESEMLEICGALSDALTGRGFILKEEDELKVEGNVITYPEPESFDTTALFLSEFSKLAALAICNNKEVSGSEDVAAELAAAFFTQSLGAEYMLDPRQHASRILGWKQAISEKRFLKAVKEGQNLADKLERMIS